MSTDLPSPQRIARLTPLKDVIAFLESKATPIAPRAVDLADARGRVLAQDCPAPSALPPHAIALRDGFAVLSDETSDASSYAPAILPVAPPFINAGERMPHGCDAVALPDTVAMQGEQAQVTAPVAPAEGVLPKAGDASAPQIFVREGTRLRASDIAVLRAAGFASVNVRQPRIRLVEAGAKDDAIVRTAASMLAAHIADSGGLVSHDEGANLSSALTDAAGDTIIAVGGTGTGRKDAAVTTLASAGDVAFHGIALSPGETAAVGMIGTCPVLLFPGRIDAALACWVTLGHALMSRLTGRAERSITRPASLSRKIASSIGMTDVVLVLRDGGTAEPLASGYWPMHAIARANGFVAVPPEREGYPAGSTVAISDLP